MQPQKQICQSALKNIVNPLVIKLQT